MPKLSTVDLRSQVESSRDLTPEAKADLLELLNARRETRNEVEEVLADSDRSSLENVETAENPLLTLCKSQLANLKGQKPSWEVVQKALTPEKLESAKKLKDPELLWVEGDELVISDGCDEVLEETLNMSYFTARQHCSDNGLEMFRRAEYEKLQRRSTKKYELNRTVTWIESGPNPSPCALNAHWVQRYGRVDFYEGNPGYGYDPRGVRRLLRVKLNIES